MRNSQPAIGKLKNFKKHIPGLFLLGVIGYLLLLIKPAILGELGGTFKAKEVPQEYIVLKNFINNQDEFFRTFWIPRQQRFGFWFHNHPALNADSFVSENECQELFCSLKEKLPDEWGKDCLPNDRCYVRELSYFLNPKTAEVLSLMAVKYVIVPFDSEGEIFLADRKYNQQQREEVEKLLDTIPWLKKINLTDKIAVYETPSYKDHFFVDLLTSSPVNKLTSWRMINPTRYLVSVRVNQSPATLIFSETYDELWQARLDSRPARLAKIGEKTIPSTLYNNLNSFTIDRTGDFDIVIEFAAQRYVYYGLIISGLTLLICIWYLVSSIL